MYDIDYYAVVGPFSVDDAMAVQPDAIVGFPSPTAVAGTGYAITLKLNSAAGRVAFAHRGTAVIVHSHSMKDGHAKHPTPGSMRKDSAKATDGAPVVDEHRGRMSVSLVIALSSLVDSTLDGIKARADADRVLLGAIENLWFHGGKAFPADNSTAVTVLAEDLAKSLAGLPAGSLLVDRRDLLVSSQAGDPLDAILDAVERRKVVDGIEGDKELFHYERLHDGWLVPIFVGYQGIERPVFRAGVRQGAGPTPHMYGESLYSLGEYRSLRSALTREEELLEGSLWLHCADETSSTLYVSAVGPVIR